MRNGSNFGDHNFFLSHPLEVKINEIMLEFLGQFYENKIPVMGHLGILPQSVKGKFKFKGKKNTERNKIFNDAKLLEKIGVFSIVLECVETTLAKQISKKLKIPTIGIGSSKFCDGQILVIEIGRAHV